MGIVSTRGAVSLACAVALATAGCSAVRTPGDPPLDRGKPVRIERGGFSQDGRRVDAIDLHARLLELPEARERVVRSSQLQRRGIMLGGIALVSDGYFLGVLSQNPPSRTAGLWVSGAVGLAATCAAAYFFGASSAEYRRAVEEHNRIVGAPAPAR